MSELLRVGVIGAGRWSNTAHLPGWRRSLLCELVAICDLDREMAQNRADWFDIPDVVTDAEDIISRDDIDVVDIVTRGDHQDLVFRALEAGKHCLVEKPVCHDYRDVWRAQELARSKGLKTKVGLTFRYAPAVMYMFDLVRQGFVGTPFIFNGYEQNSQWLDPDNPMDKRIHKTKPVGEAPWGTDPSREGITVSSLEGYGAPTIDIGLECIGSELTQVVGILANMVPHRRRTNLDTEREPINVDDADMFMGEAANGALFSLQSVRLVEESGVIQTIRTATPDAVEFAEREIPERYFPPGYREGDAWGTAFYGNLVHNFCQEIVDGGEENQGDFAQSARVQEIINAVTLSHRQRRWVDLPLSDGDQINPQTMPW